MSAFQQDYVIKFLLSDDVTVAFKWSDYYVLSTCYVLIPDSRIRKEIKLAILNSDLMSSP